MTVARSHPELIPRLLPLHAGITGVRCQAWLFRSLRYLMLIKLSSAKLKLVTCATSEQGRSPMTALTPAGLPVDLSPRPLDSVP